MASRCDYLMKQRVQGECINLLTYILNQRSRLAGRRSDLFRYTIQLERDTSEILKQRIMKIARNPRTLRQSFVVAKIYLPGNLADASLVHQPHQREARGSEGKLKPHRLIERRQDAECPSGASLIPDSVVVARDHPKSISLRGEPIVEGLSPHASFVPVAILSFELVAEAHPFRNGQTERCVIDFEIVCAMAEFDGGSIERQTASR
jgi:hypothetical protein